MRNEIKMSRKEVEDLKENVSLLKKKALSEREEMEQMQG